MTVMYSPEEVAVLPFGAARTELLRLASTQSCVLPPRYVTLVAHRAVDVAPDQTSRAAVMTMLRTNLGLLLGDSVVQELSSRT